MRIDNRYSPPDATYFTLADVAPRIEGDTIALCNGSGTRRSWGAPSVTSTVIVNAPGFAAIHVSYWCKHHTGQQWYFYSGAGEIVRLKWSELDHEQQVSVLANLGHAPAWASAPGRVSERRGCNE